jgi:hypothetical protein
MPKFAKITLGASASLVCLIVAISSCSAGTAAPASAPAVVPAVAPATANPAEDSFWAEMVRSTEVEKRYGRDHVVQIGHQVCANVGVPGVTRNSLTVHMIGQGGWPAHETASFIDAGQAHLCPGKSFVNATVPSYTALSPAATTPEPAALAPATPAPAPAAPQVFEGKGDDVITVDKGVGAAVVDFECPRCSRNVIVKTDGRDNLLVNTIGSYKGRRLIDYYDNSVTSTLEIKATGSWKMTVTEDLKTLRNSNGGAISGAGDDVVLVTHPTATKARIENHKGDGNFIVQVLSSANTYGPDLVVNTIGGYSGTALMSTPALAIVTSDGEWSITPE